MFTPQSEFPLEPSRPGTEAQPTGEEARGLNREALGGQGLLSTAPKVCFQLCRSALHSLSHRCLVVMSNSPAISCHSVCRMNTGAFLVGFSVDLCCMGHHSDHSHLTPLSPHQGGPPPPPPVCSSCPHLSLWVQPLCPCRSLYPQCPCPLFLGDS